MADDIRGSYDSDWLRDNRTENIRHRKLPTPPSSAPPAPTVTYVDYGLPRGAGRVDVKPRVLQTLTGDQNEQTQSISALNKPIPYAFGEVQVKGQLVNIAETSFGLYYLFAWAAGPIESIGDIVTGTDKVNREGYQSRTDYLGTLDQEADPKFVELKDDWTATLVVDHPFGRFGIAYSVLKYTQDKKYSTPSATVKGMKIYDPRTATWYASSNPALIQAFIWTHPIHGMKRSIDWDSVATVADECDVLVGDDKRRECCLALKNRSNFDQWLNVLSTYSQANIVDSGLTSKMVSHRQDTTADLIKFESGDIIEISMDRMKDRNDKPNAYTASYTDRSKPAWKSRSIPLVALDEVINSEVDLNESALPLPGAQNPGQAKRSAIYALNQNVLRDFSIKAVLPDFALLYELGDRFAVTYADMGLYGKPMQLTSKTETSPGRYACEFLEYDPAVFSDEIVEDPTYPDLVLPDPTTVPLVTNIAAREEIYKSGIDKVSHRLIVSWPISAWVYAQYVNVSIYKLGAQKALVFSQQCLNSQQECIANNILELVEQSNQNPHPISIAIEIRIMSVVGAIGNAVTLNTVLEGYALPPPDVTIVNVYQDRNYAIFNWAAVNDIGGISHYEIWVKPDNEPDYLYDTTSQTRYIAPLPTGQYTIRIYAVDNTGRRSESAVDARLKIVVTQDEYGNFFYRQAESYDDDLVNWIWVRNLPTYTPGVQQSQFFSKVSLSYTVSFDSTEPNIDAETLFPLAVDQYPLPMHHYFPMGAGGPIYKTKALDMGSDISGTWHFAIVADTDGDIFFDAYDDTATLVESVPINDGFWSGIAAAGEIRIDNCTFFTVTTGLGVGFISFEPETKLEKALITSGGTGGYTLNLTGVFSVIQNVRVTPSGSSAAYGQVSDETTGDPSSVKITLRDPSDGSEVAGSAYVEVTGF